MISFKYRCLVIISPLILVLDQITKWLIRERIPFGHAIPVIPGYVDLVHVMNTGAAFGMLAGGHAGWRTPFFLALSVVALAAIGRLLSTLPASARLLPVVFSLMIGGILGNVIDRLRFGAVVDFLSVHWRDVVWRADIAGLRLRIPLDWPAFNVADSAITVSMVLLCYHMIRK
ncbi:MAG: signal peptidase II [Deltaproteobacteria bacterium]|nr:signal peptidase II [Deltaproteobacteria bacterium]